MHNEPSQLLVVEDNLGDARLLREMLADSGPDAFAVDHAGSLTDALGFIDRSKTYQIILLDLNLPDSRGFETIERMQVVAAHIPIVVLTGNNDEELGDRAVEKGVQDYLVKGQIDARLLRRVIRYATQRKRMEEVLRCTNEELDWRVKVRTKELAEKGRILEAFFATSINPIVFLNKDFTFVRANEAYARACGRDAAELPGRDYLDLCPSGELKAAFTQVVQTGTPWQGFSRPLVFPDQSPPKVTYWDIAALPLLDDAGKVDFLVVSQNDVTARKSSDEARTRLQKQLHQSEKLAAIGRLASGLGHDFGNLMAAIKGWATQARRTLHDRATTVKALNLVEDSARQAEGIVKSLLTFAGNSASRKEPVNLCASLTESAYIVRHTLPPSITFLCEACDPPLWVRADPVDVERTIVNLATNARDAMSEGGTLEVTLSPASPQEQALVQEEIVGAAGFARLTVRDTGAGIPAEILPHVFEPFFTTKRRTQGAELGLSIVHGIVEDLGGAVDIRSEVGVGTTVTILLPCIEPPALAAEALEMEEETDPTPGRTILLAGGSAHIRGIMSAALRLLGFEVAQAQDETAMDACYEEHRGRVCLMIVHRDGFEGRALEYLGKLRGAGVGIPAIIVCDEADPDLEELESDDTLLLRQPFSMSDLNMAVYKALKMG